jgi:hypothetical protein
MISIVMKRKVFGLCLIILPSLLRAQISETRFPDRTRNIIWHTPCGAAKINGLAIGMQAFRFGEGTLTIKGVNCDLGMPAAMATPYCVASNFFSKKKKAELFGLDKDSAYTIIHGLSVSYGGETGVEIRGANIAGGITVATRLYGFSITGVYSRCEEFSGVVVAGLNNIAQSGKGLQIGLLNVCKHLKGVQVGLWNVNGKRKLPFINWSF